MSTLFGAQNEGRNWLLGFSVASLLLAVLGSTHVAAEELNRNTIFRLHLKANDPGGGALTFKWVQLGGPDAKILDAVASIYDDNSKKWLSDTYFIPTSAGRYTFQVTVKNDDGLESKKTYVVNAK